MIRAAVRVTGAGHSFNGGAVTDGTLLSLDALGRVLDADTATGLVRVTDAPAHVSRVEPELHRSSFGWRPFRSHGLSPWPSCGPVCSVGSPAVRWTAADVAVACLP